eukprot:CAMPEP_0198680962 /NCGR_PEP_ID=MMETSP1468-20131203/5864_1 /TAXON_ID=1461545 /ORGANISM="Mantoniella sp, Strain CCMP1436" /LENGTH=175 /DNA_ID=CAMNT_0044421985 /DNA_START=37 /DNA_END=564 /DNA_ORIENTATION=+
MAAPDGSQAAMALTSGGGNPSGSGAKSAPKLAKKLPKVKKIPKAKGGAGSDKKGKGQATDDAEDDVRAKEDHKKRKRGMLTRDLKYMMYGFGDTGDPLQETVELVEDMTLDYITNFAHRAMEVSARRGRLQTEDLLYLIRNDEKKVQRVNELLDMSVQLKEARKNFDLDESANAQ